MLMYGLATCKFILTSTALKSEKPSDGACLKVGKTNLAREFIKNKDQYLTWDDLDDRKIIKEHQINSKLGTVIFDVIHKYAGWRTLVKGLYDKYSKDLSIIVTGSARLDHFRRGGARRKI